MSLLILVLDDQPDVAALFCRQFRREVPAGRFAQDLAASAPQALRRVVAAGAGSLILLLSDINMPRMTGLEPPPHVKAIRPDLPIIMMIAMTIRPPSIRRSLRCLWIEGLRNE
jgi:CheY-like chemotaxis protein